MEHVIAVGRHFPPGTRVSKPTGGYVLWVELPGGSDTLALYDQAMAAGVPFAPGPMFSAVRGGYGNFLRLNAGDAGDRVEAAVATLGRLAGQAVRPA